MSSPVPTPAQPSPHRHLRLKLALGGCAAVLIAATLCTFAFPGYLPAAAARTVEDLTGANAHPVKLKRPAATPLSAVARLGEQIFHDPALSASGRQSCASCHSADRAHGPPNNLAVQLGGTGMNSQGMRPPPSLRYLNRQPNFFIGPDSSADNDKPIDLAQLAAQSAQAPRAQKVAGVTAAPEQMVPQGGLFWDGRVNTLQQQVSGPLFNPAEMANTSVGDVAHKLATGPYAREMMQNFGPNVFRQPTLAVDEAIFAIVRYQIEDPSFHPYDSKYDAWLEGKARLTATEMRGLRLFNDPARANCAGCHLAQPAKDGTPPLFTDFQYEALGVPRNTKLEQNKDLAFHDLGLCGPLRDDLKDQAQYCGLFLTPSLRNTTTRQAFFHNGVYGTLEQVMKFYNLRETDPAAIYPQAANGAVDKYNDLPAAYKANVDKTDSPFNRKIGDTPAMTDQDIRDIIAFLGTLTDGTGAPGR